MRNSELFSPACPDDHAKRLVLGYALRGVMDDRRHWSEERLLAAQYRVYEEWRAVLRKLNPGFTCCFHEWLARAEDSAFIFRPGDLVEYNGRYCVVMDRDARGIGWREKWRITTGTTPTKEDWPQQLTALTVKDADGRIYCPHGRACGLEPADIPPEVFELACRKAKECPMMKGGVE